MFELFGLPGNSYFPFGHQNLDDLSTPANHSAMQSSLKHKKISRIHNFYSHKPWLNLEKASIMSSGVITESESLEFSA